MTKHFWVEFFYFLSLDLLLSCMKISLTKWWWQWWLQLLLDIFCRLSVWGSMIVRAYSVSCSRFNLMIPPPVSPENNNNQKKKKKWKNKKLGREMEVGNDVEKRDNQNYQHERIKKEKGRRRRRRNCCVVLMATQHAHNGWPFSSSSSFSSVVINERFVVCLCIVTVLEFCSRKIKCNFH